MVGVTIDISKAINAIDGAADIINNQKKYRLFRTAADLLLRSYWSETFLNEGARRGHPKWVPLSPEYAKWKLGGYKAELKRIAKIAVDKKIREKKRKEKAKKDILKRISDKATGKKVSSSKKILKSVSKKLKKVTGFKKKRVKKQKVLITKTKRAPRSRKMLILTGHLQGSPKILSESQNDLLFGTEVPYGQYHQLGGGAFGHPGRPPQREFMFITQKDTEEINDFLVEMLQKIIDANIAANKGAN
jgi:phage gpG-like protein